MSTVFKPAPYCSLDFRRIDDLRENFNIRRETCDPDWWNPETQPWILSQYSAAWKPAFDFRSRRNLRERRDIRHPEYNNIVQLLLYMGKEIRPTADLDLLYSKIVDIDTARGKGLDIAGQLLGIDRKIKVRFDDNRAFGFQGSGKQGFRQATFSPHPRRGYFEQELLDYQFRRLLWFKSVANRSNDSSYDINRLLRIGLGFKVRKRVAVTDLNAMHMRCLVLYKASRLDLALIEKMLAIVKPGGVYYDMYVVPQPESTFGFAGTGFQPFGQGTFNPNRVIKLSWEPDIRKDDKIYFGINGTRRTGFNTEKTTGFNIAGTFNSLGRMNQAQGNVINQGAPK